MKAFASISIILYIQKLLSIKIQLAEIYIIYIQVQLQKAKSAMISKQYEHLCNLYHLYCKNNYQAYLLCINPKCVSSAIICEEEQCKLCTQQHLKCRMRILPPIIEKIIQKLAILQQKQKPFVLYLETINGMIQDLTEDSQAIKRQKQFLALFSYTKSFLDHLKTHKLEQITSELAECVLKELEKNQQYQLQHNFELQNQQKICKFRFAELRSKLMNSFSRKNVQSQSEENQQASFHFLLVPIQNLKSIYSAKQHKFNLKALIECCQTISFMQFRLNVQLNLKIYIQLTNPLYNPNKGLMEDQIALSRPIVISLIDGAYRQYKIIEAYSIQRQINHMNQQQYTLFFGKNSQIIIHDNLDQQGYCGRIDLQMFLKLPNFTQIPKILRIRDYEVFQIVI